MFYFDDFYGKQVLKSDLLENITHFFTTRTFLNPNSDEQARLLKENLRVLKPKRIITPQQTHSDNVELVDDREEYPNTDGIILSREGDLGCLRFADCTPIIFYDTRMKLAAISHAGWRGTAQKIGVKTVQKMGSNPKDVIAIIGAAIGLCCYEVSEDVKNTLLNTVDDKTELFNGNKVDLKQINARQLEEIGVRQIDICPYCTSCDNDKFYSYRKENGTQNRHYAVVMI
jgi:hypothetical protein